MCSLRCRISVFTRREHIFIMELSQKRYGLNTFQLKVIALVFMTFDHIAYFMSGIIDVPFWFNLIGRLSAPIFIFMVANGFRHTRDRVAYMSRLYLWSVVMSIGNFIANKYFPHPCGNMLIFNIFATMFYIVFYLYFIDRAKVYKSSGKLAKMSLCILAMVAPFAIDGIMFFMMSRGTVTSWFTIFSFFLPSPLLVEGGICWIGLGIGFFFFMDDRKKLSAFYTAMSAIFLINALPEGISFENLFILNYQWSMILALPLLLMYNQAKGRGMKNLFYIYYPAHIYLLLITARYVYPLLVS